MKPKLHYHLILLLGLLGFLTPNLVTAQGVPELIYYKFDTPGTTTQNFASTPVGTGPGTLNGATIGGTGQFGMALLGNGGSTASNSVNANWPLNLSGPWTISMWFSGVTNSLSSNYLFGGAGGSTFRAFTGSSVVSGAGNLLVRGTGMTDVPINNIFDANGSPVVVHIVYDPTTPAIRAYVNGVLHNTVAQTSTLTLTGTDFRVGGQASSVGLPSGGKIDEFRLYNRALTAAEITTTWNVSLPYMPSPNDAGVTSLVSPISPAAPGNQNLQVTIKNYGTAPLTSAQIGWKVGTTTGTTYNWTGNLAPNATSAPINIGNFNFTNGVHTVKTWTTSPNTLTDGNNFNDTISASIIVCNAMTGTYTINSNPAAGANFQSFADAVQALNSCGITGPVVFNVAANSGPYNEKITLGNIPGTSATNTITFNGNGNTISSTLTSLTDAMVTLDGSKYIRFNNLSFNAANSTSGVGFYLTNGAQFNNFSNNTVTLNSTSTGTSYGIRLQTGANNDNVFQGNTIIGGYYGLYSYGTSGALISGNDFINNEFRDPYYYGMYIYYNTDGIIEGNEIHRPTRTAGTTFYCLYPSYSTSMTISKNRIHNIGGSTIYGIYNYYSDSPVSDPTVVKNNLIYNLNNTGSTYAIYNTSSDGVHYYHNTVSLDDQISGTGLSRGFYQTTAATNIRFINNNISITRSTSGIAHALYFGTTTSGIVSNNNNLYAPGGNVGYYSGNLATLANWQAANGGAYDQNSVSANPIFIDLANGNLRPNTVALDNVGQAGTGVTDDILGNPRGAVPDLGAYELSVAANDVAVVRISGPVSGCGLTATETVTVTIRNFGSATQTSVPLAYRVNGTPMDNGTWSGTLPPNDTARFTFTVPADMSTSGSYLIEGISSLASDTNTGNDTLAVTIGNALLPGLPVTFDFETPANGVGAMRAITGSNATITEGAAASFGAGSTQGMIMAGVNSPAWETPVGLTNPWTSNPDHFAAVYMCLTPNATQQDSLILTFDLKQLYKDSHYNTNFRVTANGQQIGSTFNPPFGGHGAGGATWQHIHVDLSDYKDDASLEIGLESSVKEEFANGNGTANLIDNINIYRIFRTGVKNNLLQSLVNVYPNPSNGIFNVSLPEGKTYQLEVTDLTGKAILKTEAKNQQTQLNLQGKAKGIYLLKVSGAQGTAVRKLIVE